MDVAVFENMRELAEKGNRNLIGGLAEMYLNGTGTAADPVAACAWLLQDEAMYKEQLTAVMKRLTSAQVNEARKKAGEIRKKLP
jgi:hypothetical protein